MPDDHDRSALHEDPAYSTAVQSDLLCAIVGLHLLLHIFPNLPRLLQEVIPESRSLGLLDPEPR